MNDENGSFTRNITPTKGRECKYQQRRRRLNNRSTSTRKNSQSSDSRLFEADTAIKEQEQDLGMLNNKASDDVTNNSGKTNKLVVTIPLDKDITLNQSESDVFNMTSSPLYKKAGHRTLRMRRMITAEQQTTASMR